MDASEFDNLVRQLSATPHRRGLVRGLAGGGVASALALLGLEEAEAEFPSKCRRTAQCGPGARCKKRPGKNTGKCKCLPGLTSCPGTLGCVNTQTDNNNCGLSCTQCSAGRVCTTGTCCSSGEKPCGTSCIATSGVLRTTAPPAAQATWCARKESVAAARTRSCAVSPALRSMRAAPTAPPAARVQRYVTPTPGPVEEWTRKCAATSAFRQTGAAPATTADSSPYAAALAVSAASPDSALVRTTALARSRRRMRWQTRETRKTGTTADRKPTEAGDGAGGPPLPGPWT